MGIQFQACSYTVSDDSELLIKALAHHTVTFFLHSIATRRNQSEIENKVDMRLLSINRTPITDFGTPGSKQEVRASDCLGGYEPHITMNRIVEEVMGESHDRAR